MSELPIPVIGRCGFAVMDAREAMSHIELCHPDLLPNCSDVGNGVPCGYYPARTSDECVWCRGIPIGQVPLREG